LSSREGDEVRRAAIRRVLLVEDEAIPALEVQMRLEEWGYEVLKIESGGAAAIEAARAERPDLVVMDVVLADAVDGIRAARVIQSECPVPIVFLTAMEADVARALGDRVDCAIVGKPYNPQALREAIVRLSG
jgi:DNA-binding response OmpR family regulator